MAYKFPTHKANKLERKSRYVDFQPAIRLRAAGMKPGQQVLDVGSGTGFYTRKAAQVVGEKGYVTGIDIMPEMVDKAISLGVPMNVSYKLSEESTFPVDEASVDWVLITNLFHELEKPETFVAEVHRVLKSGGSVYLVDWIPQEEDEGPPVNHRIPQKSVIKLFHKNHMDLSAEDQIESSHYELVFRKND